MTMQKHDADTDAAIQGCLESCERLLLVVRAVTPDQYCATWKGHNGIGPHLRHCYEHLSALRDGLGAGTICYDARERDARLEHDPGAFAAAMTAITEWLAGLDATELDRPLKTSQIPQVDAAPALSESSLRRELLFVTSHTIHHLAIVSMLAELHGIALPEALGVAYSTTAHERERAAQDAPHAAATA